MEDLSNPGIGALARQVHLCTIALCCGDFINGYEHPRLQQLPLAKRPRQRLDCKGRRQNVPDGGVNVYQSG